MASKKEYKDVISDLSSYDLAEEIKNFEQDHKQRSYNPGVKEGEREILVVNNYNIITASWIANLSQKESDTRTVIYLIGHSSPSTTADKAYIYFDDNEEKLKSPRFIKSKKLIVMYQHHKNLNAVLAQLKEKNRYCWIGHFKGGHVYADIHTSAV